MRFEHFGVLALFIPLLCACTDAANPSSTRAAPATNSHGVFLSIDQATLAEYPDAQLILSPGVVRSPVAPPPDRIVPVLHPT
jgi:hypothetical protein